jgi:hypothetical protein
MKRIEGRVPFKKPRCKDCVHHIFRRIGRKHFVENYLHHCKLYNKDVPCSGSKYPVWCKDQFILRSK